jgi:hypothetical protein
MQINIIVLFLILNSVVRSDDNAKSKSDKDGNASVAEKPASNLEKTGYRSLLTNKLCTCFHILYNFLFYNIYIFFSLNYGFLFHL